MFHPATASKLVDDGVDPGGIGTPRRAGIVRRPRLGEDARAEFEQAPRSRKSDTNATGDAGDKCNTTGEGWGGFGTDGHVA
jgi:hypothetical protein